MEQDPHEKSHGKEILYKEESFLIIGACFEVYNEKGCGFVEEVYQECLEIEMALQYIPFQTKTQLNLNYKNRPLRKTFIPDMICHEKIIIELKTAKQLIDEHRAQVHNYLKATGFRLGLLINFGHYPGLEYERIVR